MAGPSPKPDAVRQSSVSPAPMRQARVSSAGILIDDTFPDRRCVGSRRPGGASVRSRAEADCGLLLEAEVSNSVRLRVYRTLSRQERNTIVSGTGTTRPPSRAQRETCVDERAVSTPCTKMPRCMRARPSLVRLSPERPSFSLVIAGLLE